MHQQSRAGPARGASPASAQNHSRPSSARQSTDMYAGQRDTPAASPRSRLGLDTGSQGGDASSRPSTESFKKLDSIIQNFYGKAAILILQSRLQSRTKTPAKKVNKWFSIETEEIDDFREELRIYKTVGGLQDRPPPLIIETYLDASGLGSTQSLVVLDEAGKRWDVLDQLNPADSSSDSESPAIVRLDRRNTDVILERWKIQLKTFPPDGVAEFGPQLPTIYKKAIVMFRSLFTTLRVLPAYKLCQAAKAKRQPDALVVRCRVLTGEPEPDSLDPLRQHLHGGSRDAVSEYMFDDIELPLGYFKASVTYRNDNEFRVDDTQSLLSSRFMDVGEDYFRPSLEHQQHQTLRRDDPRRRDSMHEGYQMPSHSRNIRDQDIPPQTYGSLSTFHGESALSTSPLTALRQVRPPGSDTSSPPDSPQVSVPRSMPTNHPGRPGVRPLDALGRRPSVSFQPFKAGSLSSGSSVPRTLEGEPAASPTSAARTAGYSALTQARNRTSLTAGMPASLRGIPNTADRDIAGSPRPSHSSRYSSSFTHRRGRLSISGVSATADGEQGSSGRQSVASSIVQPGSGLLAEAGPASSGSIQTDDENISEFIKALESNRTLRSFEAPPRRGGQSGGGAPGGGSSGGGGGGGEASSLSTSANQQQYMQRSVAAQLSRFHQMRESHIALSDSMTQSMYRSSTSSSRQLASVPGMAPPGSSLSTGSSPGGKPLSPHTPAVPSRLSMENNPPPGPSAGAGGVRGTTRTLIPINRRAPTDIEEETEEETTQTGVTTTGTSAIDIPVSPRLLADGLHALRSRPSPAAVALPQDADEDDDDLGDEEDDDDDDDDVPGNSRGKRNEARSARMRIARSMGAAERRGPAPLALRPSPSIRKEGAPGSGAAYARSQGSALPGIRDTIGIGSGGGSAGAAGGGRGSNRSSTGAAPGGPAVQDDDDLMFDMSEIGRGEAGRGKWQWRRGGRDDD